MPLWATTRNLIVFKSHGKPLMSFQEDFMIFVLVKALLRSRGGKVGGTRGTLAAVAGWLAQHPAWPPGNTPFCVVEAAGDQLAAQDLEQIRGTCILDMRTVSARRIAHSHGLHLQLGPVSGTSKVAGRKQLPAFVIPGSQLTWRPNVTSSREGPQMLLLPACGWGGAAAGLLRCAVPVHFPRLSGGPSGPSRTVQGFV